MFSKHQNIDSKGSCRPFLPKYFPMVRKILPVLNRTETFPRIFNSSSVVTVIPQKTRTVHRNKFIIPSLYWKPEPLVTLYRYQVR